MQIEYVLWWNSLILLMCGTGVWLVVLNWVVFKF